MCGETVFSFLLAGWRIIIGKAFFIIVCALLAGNVLIVVVHQIYRVRAQE